MNSKIGVQEVYRFKDRLKTHIPRYQMTVLLFFLTLLFTAFEFRNIYLIVFSIILTLVFAFILYYSMMKYLNNKYCYWIQYEKDSLR